MQSWLALRWRARILRTADYHRAARTSCRTDVDRGMMVSETAVSNRRCRSGSWCTVRVHCRQVGRLCGETMLQHIWPGTATAVRAQVVASKVARRRRNLLVSLSSRRRSYRDHPALYGVVNFVRHVLFVWHRLRCLHVSPSVDSARITLRVRHSFLCHLRVRPDAQVKPIESCSCSRGEARACRCPGPPLAGRRARRQAFRLAAMMVRYSRYMYTFCNSNIPLQHATRDLHDDG